MKQLTNSTNISKNSQTIKRKNKMPKTKKKEEGIKPNLRPKTNSGREIYRKEKLRKAKRQKQ